MKPNDKAIEAARAEGKRWQELLIRRENQIPCWKVLREADDGYDDVIAKFNSREERDKALERLRAEAMVTAAFAAQFPPSDDYAELIKALRSSSPYTLSHVAADAIEAVLAERDTVRKELIDEIKRLDRERIAWKKQQEETAALLKQVEAERDALAARLAPVDDEALVEIAARAICLVKCELAFRCKEDGVCKAPVGNFCDPNYVRTVSLGSAWRQSRAAIAAIRPHIEAAERERCAKIAERYIGYDVSYCHSDSVRSAGYVTACRAIAAAIRSGK